MISKKQNVNFFNVNKYANLKVKDDILSFHNKGNMLVDDLFVSSLCFPPLPLDILQNLEGHDTEITTFHHQSIECKSSHPISTRRNRSAAEFSGKKIDCSILQTFLNESFSANEELRRPYPSGGALYTVEVLCCLFSEKINNLATSGVYHYRPNLKKLQLLHEETSGEIIKNVLNVESEKSKQANFVLIYMINIPKAIVKYRYRGYRLAMMEVGAMFMQADLIAKELGLKNKVCSSFNDFEVTKFTQLDRCTFIPAVMQLFGT